MSELLHTDLDRSGLGVGPWTLDPARSTARIAHKTLWGLVTVSGVFTTVSGSGTVDADHGVDGTITVDAASIDTANTRRDAHLRSADFLDAEAHHDIVVTVRSGTVRDGRLELDADLTVKSVREPIRLTADITDLDADTVSVTVTGLIDRDRFGMSWNRLGMMRGLTRVTVDATFTRRTD
jgi:polyisoprenoid-binding protein YceI